MTLQFVKTERFLNLVSSIFQYDETAADDAIAAKTAGLTISPTSKQVDDMGRAYMTISQAANDKQQQQVMGSVQTGTAK